jgi:SAM-dependent methyltransferase
MLDMKKLKKLPDGRSLLNIGCGSRMHWDWNNLDFSYIGRLRKHTNSAKFLYKIKLLSEERFNRLEFIDPDIIIHNMRYPLPFDDDQLDVVYHSHFLEHIDREFAGPILKECYRVLKPGGIIRIVVPDLEQLINQYINTIKNVEIDNKELFEQHEAAIVQLFEQMVRKEGAGTKSQKTIVRFFERIIRGDANNSGETHRWMYDRVTLFALLKITGFRNIVVQSVDCSQIYNWREFYLDINKNGSSYKDNSLYVEAIK